MKRIEVAVGIIFNSQGQVLVGQRLVKDAYFQKWEFPGGKLEQGESVEAALARELKEELGITVKQSEEFMSLKHDYPDRQVRLSVRLVQSYEGDVVGVEGQAVAWLELQDLLEIDFLQGNQLIVNKLLSRFT